MGKSNSGDTEMREAFFKRETKETKIEVYIRFEGKGEGKIDTGIGFFDHMLENFARHGLFDLKVKVDGDLHVDAHHTVEDTGITLGEAFKKALTEKKGIKRSGFFIFPMDESLSLVSVDISGRPFVNFDYKFSNPKLGEFDTELVKEFLNGLARGLGMTVHVKVLNGENTHHIIESIFKALGRALKEAVELVPGINEVPSTKGVI